MKTFSQFLKEEASKEHHVMTFGRMNPITSGHEALVKKVHEVAKKHGAGHTIVLSHSQDDKKNPLSPSQKLKHAKRAFPGSNIKTSSKEKPSILHHAVELHNQGVKHLHVVVGSDRAKEMHDVMHRYNGKKMQHAGKYHFKSITVHSAGDRDPDAEGTKGMSASKMRAHAQSGNKKAFHSGAPSSMAQKHRDEMYHDVRRGLGVK